MAVPHGLCTLLLEREEEALPCFERAEALQKGDQDSLEFMRLCRFQMAFPRFAKPLRERINEFWDGMAQKTPGLGEVWPILTNARMRSRPRSPRTFRGVVPGALAHVGAIAGPVDEPLGRRRPAEDLLLLRALIRRMPEELRSDWRLTLGRRRGSIPLRFDINGRELHAGNVYLWEEKPEDGAVYRLIAYHEPSASVPTMPKPFRACRRSLTMPWAKRCG